MQTEALSNRRIASTLTIALLPMMIGITIYCYWLNLYFGEYNIRPTDGMISTIGFALLVVAVPANILGIIFLYIPWKKNRDEINSNSSLKKKFFTLFALLGINYFVAGGILYNYSWINSTISIEFTNQYEKPLKDLLVVLPNGDAVHLNYVKPNLTSDIRVFAKGEGPVQIMAINGENEKIRETLLGHITTKMGGRAKVLLKEDFSLSIFSNHPSKPQ